MACSGSSIAAAPTNSTVGAAGNTSCPYKCVDLNPRRADRRLESASVSSPQSPTRAPSTPNHSLVSSLYLLVFPISRLRRRPASPPPPPPPSLSSPHLFLVSPATLSPSSLHLLYSTLDCAFPLPLAKTLNPSVRGRRQWRRPKTRRWAHGGAALLAHAVAAAEENEMGGASSTSLHPNLVGASHSLVPFLSSDPGRRTRLRPPTAMMGGGEGKSKKRRSSPSLGTQGFHSYPLSLLSPSVRFSMER